MKCLSLQNAIIDREEETEFRSVYELLDHQHRAVDSKGGDSYNETHLYEVIELCEWSAFSPQTQPAHISHVSGFAGTCSTGVHHTSFR